MIIKEPEVKSSFLSVEKDMSLIANMFLRNPRLKKLLYYTSPDCLSRPPVSDDDAIEMFGKNIKIVPRVPIDPSVLNYVVINFDKFIPNLSNPQFRDSIIEFDILCHFDQWQLKDFQLRPYKIAAEIDTMIDNKRLTGIGKMEFAGASQIIMDGKEYAGICLIYRAVHGEEDKKFMPNPADEKQFHKDFKETFNQ